MIRTVVHEGQLMTTTDRDKIVKLTRQRRRKGMAMNKGTAKKSTLKPRPKNRLRASQLGHLLQQDIQRRVRGTTYSRDRGCYIEGRPLQPSEVVMMLLVAQKGIAEALVAARGDAKAKVVYEYEDFG